jgi:hypothetical protein
MYARSMRENLFLHSLVNRNEQHLRIGQSGICESEGAAAFRLLNRAQSIQVALATAIFSPSSAQQARRKRKPAHGAVSNALVNPS